MHSSKCSIACAKELVNFLCHFRALLIKMLRISYRKRGQTVAEILLAYAFIGLLLGIRAVLDRYEYPPYVMEEFTPLSMMMLNETTDSATHYYPGLY